jgi:hypothetical protein
LDSLHDQEGCRKEVKEDLALDAAKQDEFVSYDDVPDSNCDHEDIGEPVTKKSKT